jgi:hypothetical protein
MKLRLKRVNVFTLLSISQRPKLALGPTQAIQCVSRALSPGTKQPGREADHSMPFSAEIKNGGAIPTLLTRLHCTVFN